MEFTGDTIVIGLVRRPQIPSTTQQLRRFFINQSRRRQCFSSSAESTQNEFTGENAYDILGVSETSSFEEIKVSFRKLAKETHPDLAQSNADRFIRILAAYEILSDSDKRTHYDMHLFSQRKLVEKCSGEGPIFYKNESNITGKQMEVVEWLKWYRFAINDILAEKNHLDVGSGYFDVLEGDFYSAIHLAYYGPIIESMDFLPDCFEAEERSVYETSEVLHLVSGRDLFGMVCLGNKIPEISDVYTVGVDDLELSEMDTEQYNCYTSDTFRDLELHVYGKVVAVATRVAPKSCFEGITNDDCQDQIHVFLTSHENPICVHKGLCKDPILHGGVGSRILLGTMSGLGTNPEEGSCFVYNNSGRKTHVIMKHRTLLVKHMYWYQVGDHNSVCECRCSRARLPPSKFWLFEPRCGMHDIGGWYVETFGRDKKGRNAPSKRYWDGLEANEQLQQRLHPAMYLLALAYRTLDLEDAKRRKPTVRNIVEGKLLRFLSWCKKLV